MSLDDIFDEYVTPEKVTKSPRRPARAIGPQLAPASVTPIVPLAKRPEALELSAKLAEALAPEPVPAPPPRERLILPVGLHLDVSHEDYIADPGERPSLSSSIAQVITERSPLHAHYLHPRLGAGRSNDDSPAKGRGSILHGLLLGTGQEIEPIEADAFRTKAAKAAKKAAIEAGKVPVLASQYDELIDLGELLRKRLADKGVVLSGQSEVTALWERDGVLCRGRYDHLLPNDFLILDLKFCATASPEEIIRKMIAFGYDIQGAAYVEGLETSIPDAVGRARMQFVFVEADPPHAVTVIEPDATMRTLGARKWKRAKELWKKSIESNTWPDYSSGVLRVGAPAWAVTKDSETQFNRMENDNANHPF